MLRAAVAALLVIAATAAPAPAAGESGGQRSIPARLAPRSLLLDGDSRGALAVAVGERGHVLVSRDGGASWTQADVPTRAMLTGVYLHDESLGWAVGHDETIVRTRDGGATWELVRSAPEAERPLLDVWFRDAGHGFAVGAYGAFLVTADGGSTWEERPIAADDYHLNQIAVAADGTLYLAAEAGHVYRSDDGGESWTALATPYEGSYFGALPLADGAVLVFGLRGHLYRSEDRGATWQEIPTGVEATLMAGLELDGGDVVIAGLAGVLLRSGDGGRSFAAEAFDDRRGHAGVMRAGDVVYLLGDGGTRRLEGGR
ncbi:MAG: YCF48-related protein [Thermoanaerobaculia bacterium]|nr:YCF48-related protein [Thermoanaerobaculia bacterium]